ncbi:hypothetical protein D3C78_1452270 [compost metagenome]
MGSEAVKEGEIIKVNSSDLVVFKRVSNNQEVLVIVNTNNSESTFAASSELVNVSWKNAMDNKDFTLQSSLKLQPYQYYILSKK